MRSQLSELKMSLFLRFAKEWEGEASFTTTTTTTSSTEEKYN